MSGVETEDKQGRGGGERRGRAVHRAAARQPSADPAAPSLLILLRLSLSAPFSTPLLPGLPATATDNGCTADQSRTAVLSWGTVSCRAPAGRGAAMSLPSADVSRSQASAGRAGPRAPPPTGFRRQVSPGSGCRVRRREAAEAFP